MKPIHLRNLPISQKSAETYQHSYIVEHLASWIKPVNYLEIGVRTGTVYSLVHPWAENCYLVDINFLDIPYSLNSKKFEMTSDIFFETVDDKIQFDLVFIDGDHSKEQVYRDFTNVKDRVITDGFVILHDTYPCDERMTQPFFSNNCWEAMLDIKQDYKNEWESVTLPFNPGLTIMKKMKGNKQLIWK
jgi:predicted O-methyltransferase YrrM